MIASADAEIQVKTGRSWKRAPPEWMGIPICIEFQAHQMKDSRICREHSADYSRQILCISQKTGATFAELSACDVDSFIAAHDPGSSSRSFWRSTIRRFQEFVKAEGVPA